MTQSEINARMTTRWGDREIGRFTFRAGLFQRRGLPKAEAEFLADRLALRDQERDDRRVCRECTHAKPMLRCAAGGYPVADVLFRCHQFGWKTP